MNSEDAVNRRSSWFIGEVIKQSQNPMDVNENYLEYLTAAFDSNNKDANLWNRGQWLQNLTDVYKQDSSGDNVSGFFAAVASDVDVVEEWIAIKSLKGANPIIARYGPVAVKQAVNKWIIEHPGEPVFVEWARRGFVWGFVCEGTN